MTNNASIKNVPVKIDGNVLVDEVRHSVFARSYISKLQIKETAIEIYKSSGKGITFEDVKDRFLIKKPQAQRSLKHFHTKGTLFTAEDLISQGIYLLGNTSPQQYFATSIKADIIQDLKKRKNVLVEPTGVNLSKDSLCSSKYLERRSNTFEYQKAQSFLEVLTQIPFAPLYMHKLQLMLYIDKQYYKELTQNECRINRAKRHEEIIGRRHVNYIFSPNGTVGIAVKSSDTPFKLETDEDESIIFSFLGQVRDRLLYHVSDIRERHIPPIMGWVLKGCDLNKDVEVQDNCQMTLPDIQLKYADRVFRLYVKSLHDRAVYRSEESLVPSQVLPEALENIAHPHRSIENKVDELSKQLKHFMSSSPKWSCSHNSCSSSESQAIWSTGKGQRIRNSAQLDDGNGIVKGAGK